VISLLKKEGETVEQGETIAKLSAMKMETSISAPRSGTVKKIAVQVNDLLKTGDLILEIE
jgi:pyruvate carboxylase